MISNRARGTLRFALSTTAIVFAMAATGAVAQTTSDDQQAPTPAPSIAATPQDNSNDNNEIVVTGSRIRVPSNFTTASPVTIITREDTVLAGSRSAAETLQNSSITSGTAQINNTFLGYVSEGGPGANTVGLRGLGSQRTLVLLNGRRLAPAGAGPQLISADLNVLPDAVLSQIQILKEGASSIYGSDAVAGVVNLITDDKFNGLTIDGYTNQPVDESGGGRTYRLSVVAGKTFDRGHIMASFEMRETTALRVGDRKDFSCPTDLLFDPTTHAQIGQLNPNGVGLRCFPFANGGVGTAQNYLLGISFTTGAVNRYTFPNGNINAPLNVNNFNLRPNASSRELDNFVYSPVRTLTGYVNGAYKLGVLGDAEIYGEGLFTRRLSHQNYSGQISFDPNQIGHEVYGGSYNGVPLSAYGYPTSPFFPNSLASAANGQNNILRVFIVPPILKTSQRVDFYRANGGLRGNLGIGDLRYDANFQYSRTNSEYSVQNIDTRRLRASLDPVLAPAGTPGQYVTTAIAGEAGAGGNYTCASNVTAGAYNGGTCVAGDFFNPSTLAGNLPSNLFNYLYTNNVGTTKFEQYTGQFVVDGSLARLPAGPIGFALGAEYRHDAIDDIPSEAARTGNLYNYSSGGRTKGSDEVYEFFGELRVPLIKDKPLAYRLDLSGSARYTHYRSYGSNTTYHIGGNYAPTNFLTFRGNYGTSFRAPNLYEQFVADQSGFFGADADPCSEFAVKYSSTSNRYKNCLSALTTAIGAAKATNFIATGGPAVLTRGGAGNLKAETSTSWGGGIILMPKFADISLAVDYFNTTVKGEVALLGTTIISRCYDAADFGPNNQYCKLVGARETAQGNLTSFVNPYLNVAAQKVSGIDFDFRYGQPIGAGKAILRVQATRVIHQIYQPFAEEAPSDYNGTLGQQGFAGGPKWVGNAELRYVINNLTFRYAANYVGPMESTPSAAPIVNGVAAVSDLRAGVYITQDFSVQYKWDKIGQITFGVTNFMNRKPEEISSTDSFPRIGNYFNYSGYDFLGRSLWLNITRKF